MRGSALVPATSCMALSELDHARVLIDAASYYEAFCRAALRARRYIYISGWQFDTQARLLRPDPAAPPPYPIELLPFLNHLCETNPALEIYITAWDYSVVYALEREWLQRLKFDFQSHSRVHFEFLNHPEPGGCHHQKIVVVDGAIAFVGGLDLCDSRWDTRQHVKDDPARVDTHDKPYKPFHDIQVGLVGPVVRVIEQLFLDGWRMAGGLELRLDAGVDASGRPLDAAPEGDARGAIEGLGLPLRGRHVGVSRTEWLEDGQVIGEIQALFERVVPHGRPQDYLIRLNRGPVAAGQVLQEGDRVSITPTKIEGVRPVCSKLAA